MLLQEIVNPPRRSMLRRLRTVLSLIICSALTVYMIDFADLLPYQLHAIGHLQIIPAILSASVGVLLFWLTVTLLVGRIYCSTFCPLGVLQDVIGRVSHLFSIKRRRAFVYRKPQRLLRWGILIACALCSVLGFSIVLSFFDPYSTYGRMVVHLFRPLLIIISNKTSLYASDLFTLLIATFTLAVIVFFSWRYGRLWCNTLCPVGTLMGAFSRFSRYKIRINAQQCNGCGLCVSTCKASCIDAVSHAVDSSRCVNCFNCIDACKKNALSFGRFSNKPVEVKDLSRRLFLKNSMITVVALPFSLRAKTLLWEHGKMVGIAPPGAISHHHLLHHCTACHLCISKCPSKALKPAFTEYGIEGLMQPVVHFEKGYCSYNCTLCGEVCPNGAIRRLSIEKKHLTQIGHAVFNHQFCIACTNGVRCGVCVEHCPTQAISMLAHENSTRTIPHVNINLCIGCGACEFVCPARPRAVRVDGNTVHVMLKDGY